MAAGRMHRGRLLAALACALALVAQSAHSEEARAGRQLLGASDHKFKPGEDVVLYANKVGPYSNPR